MTERKRATREQLLEALRISTQQCYDLMKGWGEGELCESLQETVDRNQELLAGDDAQIEVDESEMVGKGQGGP